jgi:hypothetical protein
MHGNFVNVHGIDNTVNASNVVNNYSQSSSNDWTLKAGLWLVLTGALGNLCAEFIGELLKKLF